LLEFTRNGEKFDFETRSIKNYHVIKISGLKKDKAVMYLLAAALNSYVIGSVKSEPTEVCTSMCHNSLKGPSKINDVIKTLQKKYNKIIKEFDTNKPNKVVVTYWKVELPEGQAPTDQVPDWEYVRNIVEGCIPH
jgi:hypothetical protein